MEYEGRKECLKGKVLRESGPELISQTDAKKERYQSEYVRPTKTPLNPRRYSQAFGSNVAAGPPPPLRYNAAPASLLGCHRYDRHSLVAATPSLDRRCYAAPSLPIFFAISSCLSHSSSPTFDKALLKPIKMDKK
ncbi:hypothetical protein MUK42_11555 [Musa troglodytarum]|uniref:Uncharacterized protein n=1 Tax=Musa troglodytarum TaxID=320322 RepID=A0A9E7KK63_9LILI|nr:hypothetical protein MUK42_11555 [Musa troglodytarum]